MGAVLDHDWYPAPVPDNVSIGPRSWLHSSFAFLHYRSERPLGVRIGEDSGVYRGSFFELGPDGEVDIGKFCTLVGAIINTNRRIEIRDYVFIAHEVLVCDGPVAVPFGTSTADSLGTLTIGENAWIGARAMLIGEASIGEGAIVGAGAVVFEPVPPYTTVAGNPAQIVGQSR